MRCSRCVYAYTCAKYSWKLKKFIVAEPLRRKGTGITLLRWHIIPNERSMVLCTAQVMFSVVTRHVSRDNRALLVYRPVGVSPWNHSKH